VFTTTGPPSDNPALPIPTQQPQHLPLPHGVFARKLQHTFLISIWQLSARREFETNTMRQFLTIEVGRVRSFEV
jgi:hypothetical protein